MCVFLGILDGFWACDASLALLCMQLCNPVCLDQPRGLSSLYCLETAQGDPNTYNIEQTLQL